MLLNIYLIRYLRSNAYISIIARISRSRVVKFLTKNCYLLDTHRDKRKLVVGSFFNRKLTSNERKYSPQVY